MSRPADILAAYAKNNH